MSVLPRKFFRAVFELLWAHACQKQRESCKRPSFEPRKLSKGRFLTYFLFLERDVRGFYVRAKYYYVESGASDEYARSILRQVQSEQGDQEPSERHAQERQGRDKGHLPRLRDFGLPHRQGLSQGFALQRCLIPLFPRMVLAPWEPFYRHSR